MVMPAFRIWSNCSSAGDSDASIAPERRSLTSAFASCLITITTFAAGAFVPQ